MGFVGRVVPIKDVVTLIKACDLALRETPLDVRIIGLFAAEPGVGVLAASRRLGVARGTVQARLDRLVDRGVIRSFAPHLDPAALGYPVTAFCTLEIRQGRGHGPVLRRHPLPDAVRQPHRLHDL